MGWIEPLLKKRQKARGTIKLSYIEVTKKLGDPNTTLIEDNPDVTASWAFKDDQDREAFVWGFHTVDENVIYWKCGGDPFLLQKVFGHAFEGSISGWA